MPNCPFKREVNAQTAVLMLMLLLQLVEDGVTVDGGGVEK